MERKIKTVYKNLQYPGIIEILSKTDKTEYVTWSIYDPQNNFIASVTNSYYFESGTFDNEEIF